MSESSNRNDIGPLNPYQPPDELGVELTQLKTLMIEPIEFPAGPTLCSYYSYEEFARTLLADLAESSVPFGLRAVTPPQKVQTREAEATIRCRLHDIRQYHLTNWQRFIKWFLPFMGYQYYPASFNISGTIEIPHRATVSFQAARKFDRGGLGEKANMRNGIRAEAIRLVGLAAQAVDSSLPVKPHNYFWQYVLLAPLVTGCVSALGSYLTLHYAIWRTAVVAQDTKVSQIFAATVLATLIPQLTIVFAPRCIYCDRRASFAYRFISSTNSRTLRVFLFICAVIISFLVALILVIVLSNLK